MGLFRKKRIREYDPDTPEVLRTMLDKMPSDPEEMIHVSLSLNITELLTFAQVLTEARKRLTEAEVK